MRDDGGEILPRQRRDTARPGGSAHRARPRSIRAPRPRRRSAAPARRAAAAGIASRSSSPRRDAVEQRRAFDQLVARQREQPALGRARRRRARSARPAAGRLAIERGEPSWQTRSTSPMSMPSSSEAVATSALSLPRLSRCSASSRCSLARLPWCAATCSAPSRSDSWRVTRSAIRRVLTKISVVRCASISSARRSIDLLPDLARHHRFERRCRHLEREVARPAMAGVDDRAVGAWCRWSSSDQKARDRFDRLLGGREADRAAADRRTARPGARARAPDGCRACSGPARGSRRRSRCAWSRASRGRIPSRAGCRAIPAWSRRCAAGGGACGRARPAACRRCAPRCGSRRRAGPARCKASRMPASGASRLRWMSFDSALSGET